MDVGRRQPKLAVASPPTAVHWPEPETVLGRAAGEPRGTGGGPSPEGCLKLLNITKYSSKHFFMQKVESNLSFYPIFWMRLKKICITYFILRMVLI